MLFIRMQIDFFFLKENFSDYLDDLGGVGPRKWGTNVRTWGWHLHVPWGLILIMIVLELCQGFYEAINHINSLPKIDQLVGATK